MRLLFKIIFSTTVHYLQYNTYNTYLQFGYLRYLLTIWDTYTTNNTLLYSLYRPIYIYTYIYISVLHKKRGGGVM